MRTRKISLFVTVLMLSCIAESLSPVAYKQNLSESSFEGLSFVASTTREFELLEKEVASLSLRASFSRLASFQKNLSQSRSLASKLEDEEEIALDYIKESLALIPDAKSFQASACGEYSHQIKREMDGVDQYEQLNPVTKTTLNILWKLCEKGGS